VVNTAFVNRYWPDQDPVGKRVRIGGEDGDDITVVGVTPTVKHWLVGEEPRPYLFLALTQFPSRSMVALLLRTHGDPLAVAGPANAAIRQLDPAISVSSTNTLTEMIGYNLLPARLAAVTFGGFGLLALLMAAVGLHGVMAQAVGQRTHEIGIRAALGAGAAELMRMVLANGLRLTAIGVVLGLAVSAALTRLVSGLLYAVDPLDAITFLGVTVGLTAVAMLACWIPARRAARVDPAVALRCE
jgi:predicted lysophospholipase L1 biosynthesis ABC-type transport system permease subunit